MNDMDWLDDLPEKTPEIVKPALTVPRLPRLPLEKSGRLEPAQTLDAPTAPTAPTENNVYRAESDQQSGVGMGGQRIKSAAKTDQGEAWAAGFLTCWQTLFDCGLILRPAQQSGHECQGCKHMTMTVEHWPDKRRKFFIRCDLGYQQMETGYAMQRVIIAPFECEHFER